MPSPASGRSSASRGAAARCLLLLDEFEAFCLVVGQAGLEEDRVDAELGVEQRHVPVHLHEEVDALVPLVEVGIVVGERLGAAGAAESPAGGHLQEKDGAGHCSCV